MCDLYLHGKSSILFLDIYFNGAFWESHGSRLTSIRKGQPTPTLNPKAAKMQVYICIYILHLWHSVAYKLTYAIDGVSE